MRWRDAEEEIEGMSVQNRGIEGDYFAAMGIDLLEGRTFRAPTAERFPAWAHHPERAA
ncbi:MAG: hypothetical protein O7I93_14030 [Gemmatimonadetes bacterium]|nr:hypothetical protein [Gemmatimonadota bacterium]